VRAGGTSYGKRRLITSGITEIMAVVEARCAET
jgi:hypothetical protein